MRPLPNQVVRPLGLDREREKKVSSFHPELELSDQVSKLSKNALLPGINQPHKKPESCEVEKKGPD